MKITLQFFCPESFESGDIQLQTVKVLTKNGVTITIPYHAREFKKGLWETIKKRAGWR